MISAQRLRAFSAPRRTTHTRAPKIGNKVIDDWETSKNSLNLSLLISFELLEVSESHTLLLEEGIRVGLSPHELAEAFTFQP